MPVNSLHPAYEQRLPQWKRCRDAYEGSDAVKSAGQEYLPRPGGHSDSDYRGYKTRAMFYDAFSRTVEGLVGSIARKAPKLKAPEKLMFVEDDITGTGVGLLEFIKSAAMEVLITGRVGLLVEFDEVRNRPFLSYCRAEHVINWFDDGGVVIEEVVNESDPADPFKVSAITQWRHMGLADGVYVSNVWRKRDGPMGEEFYIHSSVTPNRRKQTFDAVPFLFLSRKGSGTATEKPPLLGLVDVVLSHYMTSADLEHGRHFTALPALFITGMDPTVEGGPIRIGGSEAIILQAPEAKVGYAEFSGEGLGSLEKGLEQKEAQMAVLGAQLFGNKAGVEAAETARIRTSGESSLLSSIVSSTEEVMEAVLNLMAKWMGLKGEIDLHVNRDFVGERITSQEITALLQAYTSGAMPLESFLHNLQVGEMLPADLDVKKHAADLEAQAEKQAEKAAALAMKTAAMQAVEKTE